MSERIQPISELAVEYGVSRKTVYKWIGRHAAGGWAALADETRAPHHHPNAVPVEIERLLLELKARRPLWCADFKGWFRTGDGHSRYLLRC